MVVTNGQFLDSEPGIGNDVPLRFRSHIQRHLLSKDKTILSLANVLVHV